MKDRTRLERNMGGMGDEMIDLIEKKKSFVENFVRKYDMTKCSLYLIVTTMEQLQLSREDGFCSVIPSLLLHETTNTYT